MTVQAPAASRAHGARSAPPADRRHHAHRRPLAPTGAGGARVSDLRTAPAPACVFRRASGQPLKSTEHSKMLLSLQFCL